MAQFDLFVSLAVGGDVTIARETHGVVEEIVRGLPTIQFEGVQHQIWFAYPENLMKAKDFLILFFIIHFDLLPHNFVILSQTYLTE